VPAYCVRSEQPRDGNLRLPCCWAARQNPGPGRPRFVCPRANIGGARGRPAQGRSVGPAGVAVSAPVQATARRAGSARPHRPTHNSPGSSASTGVTRSTGTRRRPARQAGRGSRHASASMELGRIALHGAIGRRHLAAARISTALEGGSSGSATRSTPVGGWQPPTTSWRPTTSHSSNLRFKEPAT
jgi:hypothetical protein